MKNSITRYLQNITKYLNRLHDFRCHIASSTQLTRFSRNRNFQLMRTKHRTKHIELSCECVLATNSIDAQREYAHMFTIAGTCHVPSAESGPQ